MKKIKNFEFPLLPELPYLHQQCKFNKRIKCSEPIFCRCDDSYTFIYCKHNPHNIKETY